MISPKKIGEFISSGCVAIFFALLTVKLLNVGAIGKMSWLWVLSPMILYVIILIMALSVIGAITIYKVNKKVKDHENDN
jgi:ABC-type siderophore export system fused ATPase/permease subunit